LKRIEPAVHSDDLVNVLLLRAVVGNHSHSFMELRVIREDGASVTVSAKVLRRKEGEATDVTDITCRLSVYARSYRLSIILNDTEIMSPSDLHHASHICRLSEKVNGHDGLRSLGYCRLDSFWINIEGVGIDVHPDRPGTEEKRRFGRRDKCERSSDHFISLPDAESHECNLESIGTIPDAHGVSPAQPRSELPFKGGDIWTADECGLAYHAFDRRENFVPDVLELIPKIDHLKGRRRDWSTAH
jgi:hypothetical protein